MPDTAYDQWDGEGKVVGAVDEKLHDHGTVEKGTAAGGGKAITLTCDNGKALDGKVPVVPRLSLSRRPPGQS